MGAGVGKSSALPAGTVRALVGSGRVTPNTRNALEARLETPPVTVPRFLDPEAFALLRVVCARLVAADDDPAVDIAGAIDGRLADGRGDGWRYDTMPTDGDAYRLGLEGIDKTAKAIGGKRFIALDGTTQEQVLQAVRRGDPPGSAWERLPAAGFFEDLLAEAAEIYFAHPLVQERIGYLGFADVLGWHAIGLDDSEQPEPSPRHD